MASQKSRMDSKLKKTTDATPELLHASLTFWEKTFTQVYLGILSKAMRHDQTLKNFKYNRKNYYKAASKAAEIADAALYEWQRRHEVETVELVSMEKFPDAGKVEWPAT